VIATIEEYDPVKDRWTKKADMPTARNCFSASTVNGRIYAIGGVDIADKNVATVEEYDPSTDTWTKKADMPTPRFAFSTSVVDGKIYAIGGAIDPKVGPHTTAVEEYDPATDTWTKKADIPTKRHYLCANSAEGKVYAMGGFRAKWQDWNLALSVEEYDPATDKWTKKPEMPTARRLLSASAVKGKIYAIGGSTADNVPLATVEEYTPEGWPFAVSPQGKLSKTWGKIKCASR
jgi:N-acetylneuraminic acid mutarotase